MVDLKGQYQSIKPEIEKAIHECLDSARFIGGPVVRRFETALADYLDVLHVVSCANGTDALQIALMALDLKKGAEVIVPSFTYAATAEVVALLGLTPILVDVDSRSFNSTAELISEVVTNKTRVIVPVHLFGQSADMGPIMELAEKHNLYVVEDNAQGIGSDYTFSDGRIAKTGTIGHIGCTSFFPSKNLGCYGDGGALFSNDDGLADRIRMIANHGQAQKYFHSVVGVNSRLDALQAGILEVKLKYLDKYCQRRKEAADYYDAALSKVHAIEIPHRDSFSSHVFHQYTLKISGNKRDELKNYLADLEIPSMIYYPLPLYEQDAFRHYHSGKRLDVTHDLCKSVLSLPIHTEMHTDEQDKITDAITTFF